MTFEELVNKERSYQDKLWGQQNHPPDKWLVILVKEVGELSKEILEYDTTDKWSMEEELIQAAAVLKAMWESGKRNGWL